MDGARFESATLSSKETQFWIRPEATMLDPSSEEQVLSTNRETDGVPVG
jgi:hypothetical protein